MKLSVLIISVFSRDTTRLFSKLNEQIGKKPVEFLVLTDNRRQTLGEKRNALLKIAKGDWIVQIDDDDDVSDDFVDTLLAEIDKDPEVEVISYDSECVLLWGDNPTNPFRVRTGVGKGNQQAQVIDGKWIDIVREPWFWCCWRREYVLKKNKTGAWFPEDGRMGDDWDWLKQLLPCREVHLDRIMYIYLYDVNKSLCTDVFQSGGHPSSGG